MLNKLGAVVVDQADGNGGLVINDGDGLGQSEGAVEGDPDVLSGFSGEDGLGGGETVSDCVHHPACQVMGLEIEQVVSGFGEQGDDGGCGTSQEGNSCVQTLVDGVGGVINDGGDDLLGMYKNKLRIVRRGKG